MVRVTVERILRDLERDGYALLENAMSPEAVAFAKAETERLLPHTPYGRGEFEGYKTRRVYGVFGKTRAFDDAATHPVVLEVLDRLLGSYQLGAPTIIDIGPGERAQPLHFDDALYPLPRPHKDVVVTVMWPLDDFTEANGATRVVRGSHEQWDTVPDANTPAECIEMPAGSALLYVGRLWHGGGANATDQSRAGIVLLYAQGWLRQGENQQLVVPPEMARDLPERLQELLGYNIHPPFLGYVDGRHPRKLLT